MTRLENVYREKVVPVLQKEFAYSSPMQIPGIVKISLNIGLGSASQNNKLMEEAVAELTASIRPGIIFTPSHFTGTSPHAATRSKPINAILPNYWDRVSAQFNGVGCTLEKA